MRMSDSEFNNLFDSIDNSFVGNEESAYQYQQRYADYFKDKSLVLDVGCGRGSFLKVLKENNIEGIGLDMNKENINYCLSQDYGVAQCDAFDYLEAVGNVWSEGKFEGVSMFHMIEHFDARTAVKLLVLIYEVLKKDGVVVIVTPNFEVQKVRESNFWLSSTHVRPYPKEWLANAFNNIGFEVIEIGADKNSPLDDTYIVGVKKQ